MSDLTSSTHQLINVPSNQTHNMDYINNLPLNQPVLNPDMDQDSIYSYPLYQAYSQPPSQVIFPSDTGPLDNNNVYAGVNTQRNSEYYGYSTTNDANRVNFRSEVEGG